MLHCCAELFPGTGLFVWDSAAHGSDLAAGSVDHFGGHCVKVWISSYLNNRIDWVQMGISNTSRKNSK